MYYRNNWGRYNGYGRGYDYDPYYPTGLCAPTIYPSIYPTLYPTLYPTDLETLAAIQPIGVSGGLGLGLGIL